MIILVNSIAEGVKLANFGRVAEKKFSQACSEAGITCNKSEEDDHGWDFILDITSPVDPNKLLSEQIAPRQALVQVKSTAQNKQTCSMKLSNALKIAQFPKVCYVAFYKFVGNDTRIYLKHIWENEIFNIHKKATECEAKGNAQFHKVKYEMRFHEGELIEGNIAEAIKKHQTCLTDNYPSQKIGIANAVGFENGNGTGKVTLGLESQDEFLKLMLGLRKEAPCHKFSLTRSRFDIKVPHLSMDFEGGTFSVEPEYSSVKVRIRINGIRPLFFGAKTTSFHLGNDLFGLRLDIAGMTFILSSNSSVKNENFTVNREERKPLSELIFIYGCILEKSLEIDVMTENEWKFLTKLTCNSELSKIGYFEVLKYLVWLQQLETEILGESLIEFSMFELDDILKQLHDAYVCGNYDGASLGLTGDTSKMPDGTSILIRPVFIFTESQLITLVTKSTISRIMKKKIVLKKFAVENIRVFHGENKIEESIAWYDVELEKFHGKNGILYIRPSNSE